MAMRRGLLWSALPALVAAAAPAAATLAECDATALLQSHSDVDTAATAKQARLKPQRTKPADAPQITANNYWMFNYGRHRPKSQVEKTIVIMTNYSAIARAYPDFTIPNAGSAANGTTMKKLLGDLKGAFTNLKRDLTNHAKVLNNALFQIHMNLPLALQAADTPFQDKWRSSFHDIILAVQRHRNILAGFGASDKKLCAKVVDFLNDLRWQGGNYSRFLDEASGMLPPPLPEGNGFINATALEARRSMYATSKIMVLHMSEQVRAVLVPWMDQWMGCELASLLAPPEAPTAEVQLHSQVRLQEQQLHQKEQQLQQLRQQLQQLQQQPAAPQQPAAAAQQPAAPEPAAAPEQPVAPQPAAAPQQPAAQQQRQAAPKKKNPWPDIGTEAELAAAELHQDVPDAGEQQQQQEEQPQAQPQQQPQQQEEAQNQEAAQAQAAEPQQEPQSGSALRRTCRLGLSAAALLGLLSV